MKLVRICMMLCVCLFSLSLLGQEAGEIAYIWRIKQPRCGELFSFSAYEGEMVLAEKYLATVPKTYGIRASEKDSEGELIEFFDSDCWVNKYSNLAFAGVLACDTILSDHMMFLDYYPQGKWDVYQTDEKTGTKWKIRSMNFDHRKMTGEYIVWDINGNVLYQTEADTLGVWTMKDYYPTGGIRIEGKYLNGKRTGNWKWYDEKGRKIIEEVYARGKWVKRLVPYGFDLHVIADDPGTKTGAFVILEDEHDGSVSSENLNTLKDSVLQLRDTTGINLYFCLFGHVPQRVKVSDVHASPDGKRTITVQPVQGKVYVCKKYWRRTPWRDRPEEWFITDAQNDYHLPSLVNEKYMSTDYWNTYGYTPSMLRNLSDILHGEYIIYALAKGQNIDFEFLVSGEGKILQVSGHSETLPRRRLKKLVSYMQYLTGKEVPVHHIRHKKKYVYCVSFENEIEYPVALRKKVLKDIKKKIPEWNLETR